MIFSALTKGWKIDNDPKQRFGELGSISFRRERTPRSEVSTRILSAAHSPPTRSDHEGPLCPIGLLHARVEFNLVEIDVFNALFRAPARFCRVKQEVRSDQPRPVEQGIERRDLDQTPSHHERALGFAGRKEL